ncbi:hypothetical protein BC829DRAFT_395136 [Chytridium lagenaria]|nr:hypothetical protein BC829DRAFT_395136 [Chytridium lagenaria]
MPPTTATPTAAPAGAATPPRNTFAEVTKDGAVVAVYSQNPAVSLFQVHILIFFSPVFLGASYILYSRFFSSGSRHYTKALWGTILSYGIIIYKAHGVPQISKGYLQRIMMDENMHYLILSLVWLSSKPMWVVLIPFVTFSLFHSANYARTELLPKLIPSTSALHSTLTTRIQPALLKFSQTYQSKGLEAVAYLEVWGLPLYLIFSLLTGGAGFLTPVLYFQFLRFRYFFSALTRRAAGDLRKRMDGYIVDREATPEWIKAVYRRAMEALEKFGDVTAGQGQAAPPAGGPAAQPNMTQTR